MVSRLKFVAIVLAFYICNTGNTVTGGGVDGPKSSPRLLASTANKCNNLTLIIITNNCNPKCLCKTSNSVYRCLNLNHL